MARDFTPGITHEKDPAEKLDYVSVFIRMD
jgi:hypothetical protein